MGAKNDHLARSLDNLYQQCKVVELVDYLTNPNGSAQVNKSSLRSDAARVASSVTGIRYHSVPMEIPSEIPVVASFYWFWNDPQQFPLVMERHVRNSSSNSLTF